MMLIALFRQTDKGQNIKWLEGMFHDKCLQMSEIKVKVLTDQRHKRCHDGSVQHSCTIMTSDSTVARVECSAEYAAKLQKGNFSYITAYRTTRHQGEVTMKMLQQTKTFKTSSFMYDKDSEKKFINAPVVSIAETKGSEHQRHISVIGAVTNAADT